MTTLNAVAHPGGRRPRIVTLGDLVIDVIVTGDVSAAREAGGAVQIFPGGSAANFAVGAARAGAEIRFIGCAGEDVTGRLVVGELEREGVLASVRTVPGIATGYVLVMHEADGASRMIAEPGASRALSPHDVDPTWLTDIDALHVTGYSLLREGPAPAAREAVALARARSPRALVTLDPAPAHLVRDYGAARFCAALDALRFDMIFPNLEEGIALTGESDPRAIVDALAPRATVVVLKLGEDGCIIACDGIRTPAPAVRGPVVDTTGAGDAFAAGFLVSYVRERDFAVAAQAGAAAATKVIGRIGAR